MSSTITPILFLGLIALAGIIIYMSLQQKKETDQPEGDPQEGPASSPPPQAESDPRPEPEGPLPGTCPACGHLNPEENNFCEQCGEKLD